jgi:D-alanyl-lipoteichoic acid acyltransferase DltB (MBOAT superfamily)
VAFNSVQFAVLLAVTLAVYWQLPRATRPAALLLASVAFYAYADWRFCFLLAVVTVVAYAAGLLLERIDDEPTRRTITATAIVAVLVVLGLFKYFDFFIDGFVDLAGSFGWDPPRYSLAIALPIGLSFYVFQAISYVVDVARRDAEAVHDPVIFATYMAYFPKMLAGPIERSRHLVPQLEDLPDRLAPGRSLEAVELIVIGLFKKVAVADVMLRVMVDVYAPLDLTTGNGWTTLLVSLPAFGVQIYCDFSGYSDIARGVSKLFGIELNRNFLRPKNSRTVLEFWQRWHVTFTRFIRDYLLRPLGGFHGSDEILMRNAIIVFTLTGLWHGARWPVVVWGVLLGVAVGISLVLNRRRRSSRPGRPARGERTPRPRPSADAPAATATATRIAPARSGRFWRDTRKRAQVLGLLLISTPLFVAPTMSAALTVYKGIFTLTPGPFELHHWITVTYGVIAVILIDHHQQRFESDEDRRARARRMGRTDEAADVSLLTSWRWQIWTAVMVLAIVIHGANVQAAEFYYFQF